MYLLKIFQQTISIDSDSNFLNNIIEKNFSAFILNNFKSSQCDISYHISVNNKHTEYKIVRNQEVTIVCHDPGLFVFNLEKDITIEIQHLCNELFFMHGAALEKNNELLLLTGRSGAGKSTTTWGLLNNGFNYLSDELAPINLDTMQVSPYPHAVCLKKHPPLYPLPEKTLITERTMHVPVETLPCEVHLESFPLTKVILVEYSVDNSKPQLTKLSKAEACMNIYTNALNQLAHENDGLGAASKIAENCDVYSLQAAQLDKTCDLIKTLF